jgi:hypothetical protein
MSNKTNSNTVVECLALHYVKVQRPDTFNKYAADLVITKATKQSLEKKYPNLKRRFTALDADDYLAKYKMESPLPDAIVYLMKMDIQETITAKETGKVIPKARPKVLLQGADGTATDITMSRLVGNGSKGKVVLLHRESTSADYGTTDKLSLGNILITELVEYQGKSGGDNAEFEGSNPQDDFGLTSIVVEEPSAAALAAQAAASDAPPFDAADEDEY